MREIRNKDGRLVCKINDTTGAIQIINKGCVTLIERDDDGEFKISNS